MYYADYFFFYARSQNCEKNDSYPRHPCLSCLSVRLSIRVKQLGSYWEGFISLSVCLSVRPRDTTRLFLDGFECILKFEDFLKIS